MLCCRAANNQLVIIDCVCPSSALVARSWAQHKQVWEGVRTKEGWDENLILPLRMLYRPCLTQLTHPRSMFRSGKVWVWVSLLGPPLPPPTPPANLTLLLPHPARGFFASLPSECSEPWPAWPIKIKMGDCQLKVLS